MSSLRVRITSFSIVCIIFTYLDGEEADNNITFEGIQADEDIDAGFIEMSGFSTINDNNSPEPPTPPTPGRTMRSLNVKELAANVKEDNLNGY